MVAKLAMCVERNSVELHNDASVSLLLRRSQQRDDFPLVAPVDAEVGVDGDERVVRIEFAHADQAEIGEIGVTLGVASSQFPQLLPIFVQIEGQLQKAILHKFKDSFGGA